MSKDLPSFNELLRDEIFINKLSKDSYSRFCLSKLLCTEYMEYLLKYILIYIKPNNPFGFSRYSNLQPYVADIAEKAFAIEKYNLNPNPKFLATIIFKLGECAFVLTKSSDVIVLLARKLLDIKMPSNEYRKIITGLAALARAGKLSADGYFRDISCLVIYFAQKLVDSGRAHYRDCIEIVWSLGGLAEKNVCLNNPSFVILPLLREITNKLDSIALNDGVKVSWALGKLLSTNILSANICYEVFNFTATLARMIYSYANTVPAFIIEPEALPRLLLTHKLISQSLANTLTEKGYPYRCEYLSRDYFLDVVFPWQQLVYMLFPKQKLMVEIHGKFYRDEVLVKNGCRVLRIGFTNFSYGNLGVCIDLICSRIIRELDTPMLPMKVATHLTFFTPIRDNRIEGGDFFSPTMGWRRK